VWWAELGEGATFSSIDCLRFFFDFRKQLTQEKAFETPVLRFLSPGPDIAKSCGAVRLLRFVSDDQSK
jgi:hypothetical protein